MSQTELVVEQPSMVAQIKDEGFDYTPDIDHIVTEDDTFEYDPADIEPNIDHIITEDDTPVDNIFSEKQQRLLTEPLYSSKVTLKSADDSVADPRPFYAAANVGLFYATHKPPLVPDMFLSLDVQPSQDYWAKRNRSYFVWEFGKTPEIAIEVVSNKVGGEDSRKLKKYATIAIPYYVIFDPGEHLGQEVLRVLELHLPTRTYQPMSNWWFPPIGLGLRLWEGQYENLTTRWLRWVDQQGRLIPTGGELAEQARQQVEQAHQQAEQAHQQAEQERQRAERLAAKLLELGLDPNELG